MSPRNNAAPGCDSRGQKRCGDGFDSSVTRSLGDLDALAKHLCGVYVLQLVVDDDGHRRSYFYKNLDAAQRAVGRARGRGRAAHLSLVQMVPVGVIGGGLR